MTPALVNVAMTAAGAYALNQGLKRRGNKLVRAAMLVGGGILTVNGGAKLAGMPAPIRLVTGPGGSPMLSSSSTAITVNPEVR